MSGNPAGGATALIARIHNLHDGPEVLPDIIRLGRSAIPALEAILRGPSQSLHHSRSLAAQALAAIGGPPAVAALVRALRDCIGRLPDPVSLEAEGILVNHLADHLAGHREPQVVQALLDALTLRPYPACARALGLMGDTRALPLLIGCLADDVARPAAVGALRGFGAAACTPLARALAQRKVRQGQEPPSCLDGRIAAARLLGELSNLGLALPWANHVLRQALDDVALGVRLEAALALARRGVDAVPAAAVVLEEELGHAGWMRQQEIRDALARMGGRHA